MTLSYRSVWISDVHLGTKASRATDLLHFLDGIDVDRIYLVGDIVDLERMRIKPLFTDEHQQVIRRLIALAASGTEVLYIPGNHDYEFRDLIGQVFFGIPVHLEYVHETPLGERFLIAHGDVLDGQIRKGTNLERFGAAAYYLLLELDVLINRMRRVLGKDYFSISSRIKRKLNGANEYIRRFESIAADYARDRGFDGIVCGHIHRPGLRVIDGCLYANDGDWVEHGTALAERHDGTLEILEYQPDSIRVGDSYGRPSLAAA